VLNIPRHIEMRLATLTADGPDPSIFGLVEAPSAQVTPSPDIVRASAVVIHVDNLERAVLRLKESQDVEVLPEYVLTTQDGHEGREVAIINPDNHNILLYHI
jgi:hypothetical protein